MKARDACLVSCCLAVVGQIILAFVLWPSSHFLGNLFSDDAEVAGLAADLIPLSCIFMVGDAIQSVHAGSLRGLGRQAYVLFLNILGFWVLAVPVGALLTFAANLGVEGLWWGMLVGLSLASIAHHVRYRWVLAQRS